jgi:hypothetical protein
MFWHMPTAEETAAEKVCSKCKDANASKGDAWCKECRSKYQKEYRDMLEWRAERRGLIRGILATKEDAAVYFGQYAGRPFMGAEVASILRALPGPAVADESASKTQ